MMKLSLSTFAGTQYHDKGDEIFHRNKFCGSVNRLQSPSHFLQEFPRHQGHTLLPVRVILGSSSNHLFRSFIISMFISKSQMDMAVSQNDRNGTK